MSGIQTLYIGTHTLCPIRDNTSRATLTTRFISKFPGEDGFGRLVARHNCFEIFTVLSLCGSMGEPSRSSGIEVCVIGWNSAVVRPVVYKGDD
jgi:hypothetical protein